MRSTAVHRRALDHCAVLRRALLLVASVCVVVGILPGPGAVPAGRAIVRTSSFGVANGRDSVRSSDRDPEGASPGPRIDLVRHPLDHLGVRRLQHWVLDGGILAFVGGLLAAASVATVRARPRGCDRRPDLPARAPPLLALG